MTDEEIKKVKEDPEVLFFYKLPDSRNPNNPFIYLIIGGKDPRTDYNNIIWFTKEEWMNKHLQGSPLAIACSEASRKYKLKEYIRITRQIEVNLPQIQNYFLSKPADILSLRELYYADQLLLEKKVFWLDPWKKIKVKTPEEIIEKCEEYWKKFW